MRTNFIVILFLTLVTSLNLFAQMGPPLGRPSILSIESVQAEGRTTEGVQNKTTVSTNYSILKTKELSIFTNLTYQDLQLYEPAFINLTYTNFKGITFSIIGNIQQENGDGWRFGTGVGSASDAIFKNSKVLTFNISAQRKNKLSGNAAFLYGFNFSNNAVIFPGLPIPTLGFEFDDKDNGTLFTIGVPTLIRQSEILPYTQWGLFAIGTFTWDVFIKNTYFETFDITLGVQKKPETFLISELIPNSPLNQLEIDQSSVYALIDLNYFSTISLGIKAAYNFKNKFRFRETATTRDEFDLDRRFQDYAVIGLNIKFLPPSK